MEERIARRLRGLPQRTMLGRRVAVAAGFRARLLGLAYMDRREAEAGLLIPRCFAVHTFGMRFALDLVFLDASGEPLELRRAVRPGRFVFCRGASAVLELPSSGVDRFGEMSRRAQRGANSARGGGESGNPADLSGADAAPETSDREPRRL
jgi:uncharacterized membrane protein (UPF0127 family)